MSWADTIPYSVKGDAIPLSPINFTCILVLFDELRQMLHHLDSQSFRSGLSSIFGRSSSLSSKAQQTCGPLDDLLYISNCQLRECYIGCHSHLEDASANELKMKVVEYTAFASTLLKAKLTIGEGEQHLIEIRSALQAHLVFAKQPSDNEFAHYIRNIRDVVEMLTGMVQVVNGLYLETLNAVSGYAYIELPNFELRKIELPVEDEDYLDQVASEIWGWMDEVPDAEQDPVVTI